APPNPGDLPIPGDPRGPGDPPNPGGLISRADALAAGWTDAAIRHAVATGRWRRLRSGIYVLAAAPGLDAHASRARNVSAAYASARTCPRAVISHGSAAIVHGLPTVCRLDRPCLTVAAGTALRHLAAAHLHRATLATHDVTEIRGVATTSAARTVLDLAREHGLDAGVAAADAALHQGLVTAGDLARALAECAGWPGSAAAGRTAALCDGLAESALESLSRLRIGVAGLPPPVLQAELGDEFGRFVARTDFYWPQFGVVGEADGIVKYDGRDALLAERRRQAALEQLGLVVVRWEWRDLSRFDPVAGRLRAAFGRGTPRAAAGERQRWSVLPPCTRIGA
ncbi:MAG: Uncharacterized protein JWO57_4166, partial [Pseudonocardiales bacterium]|nr:Uncharacterized protein [Pseudonocardiales bacterium]